jgi:serine protease
MKRAAVLFSLLLALPEVILAADTTRVIVVTRRPANEALARMRGDDFNPAARAGSIGLKTFKLINGFVADLDASEIAALRKSPEVQYLEPDVERHAFGLTPQATEAAFPQVTPYGVSLVHAPQAWVAGGGRAINVVIIDTGIDYHHPELAAVYAGGFNEITGTTDPLDDNGHGTHVAGTIAAANNSTGVVGVAPGVRIWSVKVLDSTGSGKSSNIIAALDWTVQQKQLLGGNWIASLSLGSCTPSGAERTAFSHATSSGVLVLAAAGNHEPSKPNLCTSNPDTNNSYAVSYPAAYDGVLAIAAVDGLSTQATFSNFGPQVSLSAPGVDVLSTWLVGKGETFGSVTPQGAAPMRAAAFDELPLNNFSGPYVFCGFGNVADFPASVSGKIALIKRGGPAGAAALTFHDKIKNAKKAGAVAVVIFNNRGDLFHGSVLAASTDPEDPTFPWPPAVCISQTDGQDLVDHPRASLAVVYDATASDYAIESGTSMATPHAAGVAALVWSMAPGATAEQIKTALINTAHDLGDAGVDNNYGYGLIDAEAAGQLLDNAAFHVGNRAPGRRRGH